MGSNRYRQIYKVLKMYFWALKRLVQIEHLSNIQISLMKLHSLRHTFIIFRDIKCKLGALSGISMGPEVASKSACFWCKLHLKYTHRTALVSVPDLHWRLLSWMEFFCKIWSFSKRNSLLAQKLIYHSNLKFNKMASCQRLFALTVHWLGVTLYTVTPFSSHNRVYLCLFNLHQVLVCQPRSVNFWQSVLFFRLRSTSKCQTNINFLVQCVQRLVLWLKRLFQDFL